MIEFTLNNAVGDIWLIAAVFFIAIILGFVFVGLHYFIMEPNRQLLNPVGVFIMKILGYKPNPDWNGGYSFTTYKAGYIDKKGLTYSGTGMILSVIFIVSFCSPLMLWIVINSTYVVIIMCIIVAIMYTARFAVRLNRKLSKHVKNKNRHL